MNEQRKLELRKLALEARKQIIIGTNREIDEIAMYTVTE